MTTDTTVSPYLPEQLTEARAANARLRQQLIRLNRRLAEADEALLRAACSNSLVARHSVGRALICEVRRLRDELYASRIDRATAIAARDAGIDRRAKLLFAVQLFWSALYGKNMSKADYQLQIDRALSYSQPLIAAELAARNAAESALADMDVEEFSS